MTNNINTWWLQKIDTAMGTLCACIYAIIFFAYYERTVILQKYKNNIVTPLRYIDHILLIWKETRSTKPTVFDNFKSDLNNQCNSNWETDNLRTEIDFLDLTIKINYSEGICTTKTYQNHITYSFTYPHSRHILLLFQKVLYTVY